jgi:hypothetical protein
MATDIGYNYGTATSFTISINSLAAGDDVVSSSVDGGAAPSAVAIVVKIELTGQAGNAGVCNAFLQWSDDNTDYSTVSADEAIVNDELIGVIALNTTTLVRKFIMVPAVARYFKLRIHNIDDTALGASGNAAEYQLVHIDQA